MTHYILKSEGDEFLLEAIGECIRTIERDMDMQETLLKTKEETRLYKAMLRRNMVQTLLFDQSKRTSHRDRAYEKVEMI